MKIILLTFVLITILAGSYPVSGQYDDAMDVSGERPYGGSSPSFPLECNNREARDRFIRTFLRHYCIDAEGQYDLCRECVAVACLQYMGRPTQTGRFRACIDDHNRCCTKPGVSFNNAYGAGKCYVTGWISEVGFGQVSVLRTLFGGQHRDAPRSFKGRGKIHRAPVDYEQVQD